MSKRLTRCPSNKRASRDHRRGREKEEEVVNDPRDPTAFLSSITTRGGSSTLVYVSFERSHAYDQFRALMAASAFVTSVSSSLLWYEILRSRFNYLFDRCSNDDHRPNAFDKRTLVVYEWEIDIQRKGGKRGEAFVYSSFRARALILLNIYPRVFPPFQFHEGGENIYSPINFLIVRKS